MVRLTVAVTRWILYTSTSLPDDNEESVFKTLFLFGAVGPVRSWECLSLLPQTPPPTPTGWMPHHATVLVHLEGGYPVAMRLGMPVRVPHVPSVGDTGGKPLSGCGVLRKIFREKISFF